MNVRITVPRRADNGRRDELWRFVKQWWTERHPTWQLFEGHHHDGLFNRSAAVNLAAVGEWDVLVVLDGDVICEQAQAAVDRAAETGRMTLAYTGYRALSHQMTDKVLAGYDGSWEPGALKLTGHVSSCLAVPRALWEQVGGFDDRFHGWGHEDRQFHMTCRTLGGGVEEIPGLVWHLWHPFSPERVNAKRSLDYQAGQALLKRYYDAWTPDQMRALLAERVDDAVLLLVLTDGRRECIVETIPSAEKYLTGLPVTRKVICDDSGDENYRAWLRVEFPEWEVHGSGKRQGFGGAVRNARRLAAGSGQPWVWLTEDDFIHNREAPLDEMAAVLTEHPHLLQMMLRRQPWTAREIEVGGFVEQHPDDYEEKRDGDRCWLEHARGYWTNPHLVSRDVLTRYEWPTGAGSEHKFSRQVLTGGNRSGIWGGRDDEPWITHIGEERIGKGY